MSYQTLYRKYRPNKFESIVGQDSIVKTLSEIINKQKISHAYLFSGPRGTGKTSLAKIFAAKINDIDPANINTSLDISEIDAASNNGVNEIREIIEKSRFSPVNLKYKIFIIDEAHMLTKEAFNALLKTLEEPPQYIIFILATTEPQKIPLTVMSRVQRFSFKRIKNKDIVATIKRIVRIEGFEYEDRAIEAIARIAQGSLRDALTIAEQAAIFENGYISEVQIQQVFGLASNSSLIEIINLCSQKQLSKLLKIIDELFDKGVDIQQLTSDLILALKDLIIFERASSLEHFEVLNKDELVELIATIDDAYILLDYFVQLFSEISLTKNQKQLFDLTILKICNVEGLSNKKQENKHDSNLVDIVENIVGEDPKSIVLTFERPRISIQEESARELALKPTTIIEDEKILETSNELEKTEEKQAKIEITKDIEEPLTEVIVKSEQKGENQQTSTNPTISVDEIVQLLITPGASYKNGIDKIIKVGLDKAKDFLNDPKYAKLANRFLNARSIIANEYFVLLLHPDKSVVEMINANRNSENMMDFSKELFGTPKYIFAIDKNEFKLAQSLFLKQKNENNLPKPRLFQEWIESNSEADSKNNLKTREIFGDLISEETIEEE